MTGWRPFAWRLGKSMETGWSLQPDVAPVAAKVPGSAQNALLEAGIIKDWNFGLRSRDCEWVEHRHWDFSATLEAAIWPVGERIFLRAEGLDYSGWVLVDCREVGTFCGSQTPHEWDLTEWLGDGAAHQISFVFDAPPEEQGQIGYTSQSKFFKPRYNFSWDWCPRLVPIGIWGEVALETGSQRAVRLVNQTTSLDENNAQGTLILQFQCTLEQKARVEIVVSDGKREIARREADLTPGANQITFSGLEIEPWWPNGSGAQKLYALSIRALNGSEALWEATQSIGFKRVEWRACEGAPGDAEPWICVVNGRPIFLQGVNWTPARLAYHDTTSEDWGELIALYRAMGCNTLRVWGGAFLESAEFYRQCDAAGMLVWQEFPLSSSGIDNWPPEAETAIAELRRIATSFVKRRRGHVSLLCWCGGNELQGALDGGKIGVGKPVDIHHPALAAMGEVVAQEDPERRFLPASASGPRFNADEKEFGQGLHHDVHGPWGLGAMKDLDEWRAYWAKDDALFRSEVGMAGAMSLELLHKYADGEALWPPTTALWLHSAAWWTQWERFRESLADLPAEDALKRYVEATQSLQAEALAIAARSCKERFPRCGGFLLWMGHDCFPCLSNTSVIDFERNFKPAAASLREVFQGSSQAGD